MVFTYDCQVNATVNCPVFTTLIRNGVTFSCVYQQWAYGLAAGLLCIGGLVPITLIICWWAKLKNASGDKRKTLRRQDSDASTFTDVSRPQDHGVYEVIRDENVPDMLFRTSKRGLPNRYGTFSVPDFKVYDSPVANADRLYPDLIQVPPPQSVPTSPATLAYHANLGANCSRYSSEETIPPRLARKKRRERSNDGIDSVKDSRVVKFAKRNRKRLREPSRGREHKTKGLPITRNDIKDTDDSSLSSSIENDGQIMNSERPSPIIVQKSLPTCLSSQAKARPGILSKSLSFQPTPPVKHLVEGMDFDLYLQDCVAKLPEDQRNGSFLIRDSQSDYGCKVLVLYDKEFDPRKTLYHYKICFSEDRKVYIYGSEDLFANLDAMIDFYRKKRTILPCLLSDCLGKNL